LTAIMAVDGCTVDAENMLGRMIDYDLLSETDALADHERSL
jgi:hypothetical protein